MSRSPAFQFYPHDFLAGRVATYSLEEIGAYTLLLAFDWSLNGLPTELEKLAKLCRVSTRKFAGIWPTISDQFEEHDGRYCNPRLQLEREKQAAYSAKMSQNGKLGGKPRLSRGLADRKPIESTPSPSPSPSPKEPTTTSEAERVLTHYLAAHPRRRIGPKDRKAVAAALATGYTPDDLCEAIDGNKSDTWHHEKRKHELYYVLRDTGTIDGFRDKLEASRPKLAVDPVTRLPNQAGVLALTGTDGSRR